MESTRIEEDKRKLNKTTRNLKVSLLDLKNQTIRKNTLGIYHPLKMKIIPYGKQLKK